MEERKRRVLNAIINDYIANAEPVGSRTITKKYDLGVSPATIRNEMSDLEEQGYIEQPHTSAGRIPSGKGYRYYVDHLMERERLTSSQVRQIRQVMAGELNELDHFMRSCCSMISRLTNYTAIAAVPEQGRGKVEGVQLVAVNERQILLIVMASTGIIRHQLIDLPSPITGPQLAKIEQEMQHSLLGRDLQNISFEKQREIVRDLQLKQHMAGQVMELLEQTLSLESDHRIFTGGMMNMLSQPEFQNLDKLKKVFSLLEADDKVKELISAASAGDGTLTVTIGGEMPVEGARDCSMVVANYFINGEKAGSIGVLGPTRMSYGKTVSLIEQVASELSKTMSDKNK